MSESKKVTTVTKLTRADRRRIARAKKKAQKKKGPIVSETGLISSDVIQAKQYNGAPGMVELKDNIDTTRQRYVSAAQTSRINANCGVAQMADPFRYSGQRWPDAGGNGSITFMTKFRGGTSSITDSAPITGSPTIIGGFALRPFLKSTIQKITAAAGGVLTLTASDSPDFATASTEYSAMRTISMALRAWIDDASNTAQPTLMFALLSPDELNGSSTGGVATNLGVLALNGPGFQFVPGTMTEENPFEIVWRPANLTASPYSTAAGGNLIPTAMEWHIPAVSLTGSTDNYLVAMMQAGQTAQTMQWEVIMHHEAIPFPPGTTGAPTVAVERYTAYGTSADVSNALRDNKRPTAGFIPTVAKIARAGLGALNPALTSVVDFIGDVTGLYDPHALIHRMLGFLNGMDFLDAPPSKQLEALHWLLDKRWGEAQVLIERFEARREARCFRGDPCPSVVSEYVPLQADPKTLGLLGEFKRAKQSLK